MRKNKPNYINKLASPTKLIGPMSVGVLALIGITALSPITSPDSNALTNTTAYAESRIAVQAAASVSLSLDQNVEIPVTPSSEGTFGMNSAKLKVATNNEEGYKIFLTTSNGKSTLTNTDINKTGTGYEIDSITSDTVGTAFTGNTWGYALSDSELSASSTYKAVPTSLTSIYNKTTASLGGEDNYNLVFGTHISTSLAAGEYSNSVIVSVVANPQAISTLSELVYMQDMNSNICSNTASAYKGEGVDPDRNSPYYLNPVTKQLVDVRDGKRYWVAKLADGNCWMTQNLALDLDVNEVGNAVAVTTDGRQTELNQGNTNITGVWNGNNGSSAPMKTEYEIPPLDKTEESVQATQARSWNLGKIAMTVPGNTGMCGKATLPDALKGLGYNTDSIWNSAFYTQKITDNCSYFYKEVAGWTDNYVSTLESSIDEDNQQYDAHYLIGNYYQWNAATAGTGITTNDQNTQNAEEAKTNPAKLVNAPSSICPSGWQLPKTGRYDKNENGIQGWPFAIDDSYYELFLAYGYPSNAAENLVAIGAEDASKLAETKWVSGENSAHTTIIGPDKTRVDYDPVYIVRAGTMMPYEGALGLAGYTGYVNTSTAFPGNDNNSLYILFYNVNGVSPATQNARMGGNSIRCLAK